MNYASEDPDLKENKPYTGSFSPDCVRANIGKPCKTLLSLSCGE